MHKGCRVKVSAEINTNPAYRGWVGEVVYDPKPDAEEVAVRFPNERTEKIPVAALEVIPMDYPDFEPHGRPIVITQAQLNALLYRIDELEARLQSLESSVRGEYA